MSGRISDFEGKLAELPWRGILGVVGASFLVATIANTVVASLLFPNGTGFRSVVSADSISIPTGAASLNPKGVDIILQRNIFNSEGSAEGIVEVAKPEGPQEDKLVKSDLQVKLMGTIYGGDPFSGAAIIENTSKRSINTFMVGDVLIKGATIKEILRERIIVNNSGRREYIDVEKTKIVRGRRSKKGSVSKKPGIAPIATNPPPKTYKEEGFERTDSEISMSEDYRQKLLTGDFTKVLQDAKATPNMQDGELRGFKLTRIRKDSIYEKAGFQNDDIVEEINGVSLTDTSQAIRLLQSLRNEKEIEMRVNRGGSIQRFNLQVK
jgi:general secretion pathway protein C